MRIHVKLVISLFIIVMSLSWLSAVHANPRVYVHDVVRAKDLSGAKLLSKKFEDITTANLRNSHLLKLKVISGDVGGDDTQSQKRSQLLSGLVTGKEHFGQKRYQEATKVLQASIKTFETTPGATDTVSDYLEALEYLGASFLKLDYGGDAKDIFRQRAVLSPEQELSRDFDAKVRKKYKKIRKKWLKKKKGTLQIVGTKRGMKVQIDAGQIQSAGIVGSVELSRGRHRVGCGLSETSLKFKWVKVKSKKTRSVDCGELVGSTDTTNNEKHLMTRFVDQIKLSPNGADTISDGRDLAKLAGLEYIVIPFMRARGQKLEVIGVVFSARGGLTVQIGSYGFGRDLPSVAAQAEVFARSIEGSVVTFPYQNALVPGFLTKPSSRLTDAPLSPRSSEMLSETEPSKMRRRWYKSWWFWTTTVVAVGGLSAAGYYMATADEEQGKFELEVSW